MNARDKTLDIKQASRPKRQLNRRAPSPLALEPRLMFDGAAVVDAVATATADHPADTSTATDSSVDHSVAAAAVDTSGAEAKTVDQNTTSAAPDATVPTDAPVGLQVLVDGDAAANGGRREIAFVDSAVENWSTIVAGIHPGIEVVLIDSSQDGLQQIADYLVNSSNIDAVHIISHGEEGDAVLGTLHLNSDDIADHQDELAVIGQALSPGGDILLYGCSIAAGDDGMNFIGQLSQATGANVAASTDVTGSADYNGNWTLEAATGSIEAATLLTADGQASYDGELALPGVHTGSNSTGIFLGGNYIELGIRTNNSIGKFGADTSPGGAFTGRTNASGSAIAGIGMVGDADGFGTGAALNIDYFMPGTPEEGFYAGYKIGGVATTGKNFGTSVTNTSSGNTLSATITGSIGSNLSVSQAISFGVNDLFFKNVVTLTNTGSSTLTSVRFMRSFDPDDTVDKGGSYSTVNDIDRTFAAGDNVAVVSATSSAGDTYSTLSGGKQATILYYSSDSRAKVGMATSGLAPSGVYDANVYDSASAKNTSGTYDAYISIAVDVGTLAPGASTTFTYYTSLDNRDINTIINSIASADTKSLPAINEDPGSNPGGTVSSVFAGSVAITAADNTNGQWQYSNNGGTSWSNFGSVTASSARLLDSTYSVRFVPNADWNGGSSLTYRTWDGTTYTAGGTTDASSAGTHFSSNTASATITVNAVNDVPIFTKGANQSVAEDAGAQTVAGWATGIGKGGGTDEASQTLSFNVSNNNTTLFSVQPSIDASGNLTYTAAANASGTATVTVSIHDTGGITNGGVDTSATQTFTITVNAVNDAPTLTGTAQVLNYTENAAATAIDAVVVVADADNPSSFNNGYLQAQITANGTAEDQLTVLNQGTGAGQIGVSGSNVTYGGVIIGAIDATLNGINDAALKIALNSNATVAATQALARVIGYSNNSDNPSTATRTVTYTVNDGGNTGSGGALSATHTATVNVTAVDDPTVLTLSTSTATYVENNTSFFVDANLTLSDPDSTTMNGAKVVIGAGFKSTEDQLSPASGTNADGITYTYDATKGVLTLSGSATIAQYQAALRSVKYNNTSDNPDVTPRTISITLGNVVALTIGGINHYYEVITGPVSWTAAQAAAQTHTFQGLTGYLATITSQTENDFIQQKLTADAWIGASDDYTYINAATGTTTYANQAAAEGNWYWVSGPEKGTRISIGDGSPVTVSGGFANWNTGEPNNSGSSENYGEIYSSGATPGRWNDLPNSSLAYVVEYSDSGGTPSFSKNITVTPQRVNDAPVTSGSVTLTGINEDATTNSGQLVSSFMTATDPDTDPVTGIALTGLVSSHGAWQYSLDNGATWTAVGTVSNTSALLLRTTDRVRFIPDGQNADSASISYHAWDRTNENSTTLKAGQKTDVSTNGGIAPYSTGIQTANITVTAVNDAPVLASATPTLTGINEDATSNGGQTVASFLGSSISDVDSGAQQGIAITTLSSGNGSWEYSTNGGSTWTAVGTVAGNSALLLRDTDYIRFKPDAQNGTAASFSYKAWDRTSSSQGNKVDTTVSGGTSAFSTAANTASITVSSVNDAPVLSGAALTLSGITEKNIGNAGQTVASFLGSTMSDVDSGAVQGIAITGLTVAGSGHWEYDAGSGWTTLGSASTSTALLLRATDKIRFVPDGFQGGTATLTILGWDTTSGTSGGTVDTTTNGGTTAFSLSSTPETVSIAVTDIADAPSFTDSSGTPTGPTDKTFTEAAAPAAASTSAATAVDTTLLLRDDGTGNSVKSATVTISSGFTTGDVLAANVSGTSITASYNVASGVLTLSGNDTAAHYQTVLRSVTFKSTSEDPTVNSTTRTLSWRATDTTNLTSTAITNLITVTPTADAPVMNSVPASWSYTEDDGTRIVAPTLMLSDADDTQLSGATMTITGTGYLNDGFEILAATTTGTAITASFDGSTGTLTFSGTDSVANYQKVLRSVTYTNTRDYNNPSAIPSNDFTLDGSTNTRSFSWQVTDANSDGANGSPTFGAQSSTVATTTVTLINANEVPQVTDVDGNVTHISYTEGSSPATLEGLLTVHDDGLVSSINSAFVRVTAGLAAGDELGFYSAVPGWTQTGTPTSGTLDNGAGTVITYNWSLASGDMTLTTVSGSADQTDYTTVMQHVGFVSTSDDPTASNATRTLIWRVTDSGGLESAVTAAQSTIIDITAVDDATLVDGLPSSGDVVYIEKGADVAVAPTLTLTDPDDTQVSSASVTLSGAGFIDSVEYLGLPGVSVSPSSDWSASNVGGSGIDAHYDWASGTLTLSSSSGVDIASMQALLRQVTYGSVDPNPVATANTRTLTWTVTDTFGSRLTDVPGGNDGDPGIASTPVTSTITISPRNDAPILAGLGGTVSYTEGGSSVTLAGAMTLADADDANLASANVWVSAGFTAGDTLSVSTPGGLTTSYDSGTGILTLSGVASKATYRTALRSIRYSSTSSNPTSIAPNRTLSWAITDANASGDGALASSVGTSHVNLIATDNAATVGSLSTASFTENGSAVAVAPSATLADPDDTTLAGLTVTISAGKTAGDTLAVTADLSSTGISITSYNSSTGALVLSGTASLTDYQTALRSIVFSSSSDDPTATSTTRTLTWSTVSSFASRLTDNTGSNDATPGLTTASAGTNTINITPLNDAPVIALDDGTVDPTDAPTFSQGNAPIFALHIDNTTGGVTITDPDASDVIASASVQITANLMSSDVLSIATPAGWTLAGSTLSKGGESVSFSYNAGTGTLSLSGAATRSDYATLLGSVKFSNPSVAPTTTGASRELTWSVTDSNGAGDGARTATGTSELIIRDLNDPPTVSAASPSASYIEGDASVNVPVLTVTDPDPGEIVTATLTLSNAAAGELTTSGGASYDAATGVWTLTGTVAEVNTALAALQFLPQTNNDVAVTIGYVVADGGEDGAVPATGSLTLNVTPVNDAPELTAISPVLPSINEDQTNNGGFSVASFRGGITDVDTGTLPGIALLTMTNGNGGWQYSLDGGGTWNNVGSVSDTNALVLRDSDYLRFVPNAQNATSGGFTYRAWDGTGGSAGNKLDASSTGNATPFSNTDDVASITITAVNDAPVLSSATPALTTIDEDSTGNGGQSVAALLGSSISDVDIGALQGIAITGLNAGNGAWQYSLDGGTTWSTIGAVSASGALLLDTSDLVRFLPDTHNATTASFSYKAWDRSTGTAGNAADTTTSSGGTGAYSLTSNTASINVTAVNDAPVLTAYSPSLTTITEDDTNNTGQTVASLLGGSVNDVDSGALQGIAVTDLNAGNGGWQYSLDGGSTWNTLSEPAAGNGLLLRDTDRVRFVPDAKNATSASLSYIAWDRSSGTAGSTVSTVVTGGASAFSTVQDTASIMVTPVNDAPINDVAPTFSGGQRSDTSLRQDGVLTANPETWHDVDMGDPAVAFQYQWQVADDASGTNLHDISGATALNYMVTAADIGKYMRVKVSGSDGIVATIAYSTYTLVTNHDPVANLVLAAQQTTESVPISFTVPGNAFIDPDAEDTLYYTATLADGTPLPAWLTFDPATRSFSGTPGGADTGIIDVRVTASDHGQHDAHTDFTLHVLSLPVNQGDGGTPATVTPPPLAPNVDPSTPVASSDGTPFLHNGDASDNAALSNQSLSTNDTGAPTTFDDGGAIKGEVGNTGTSLDPSHANGINEPLMQAGGLTRPDGFRIVVEPSPSDDISLLLMHPLNDQFSKPAEQIRLSVPVDTFVHTQRDAVITLSVSRTDGARLPSWLHFDAMKGEFRSNPPADFDGDIEIKVTAHDNFGNEASTVFRFRVHAHKPKAAFTGRQGLSTQLNTQLRAHVGAAALPRIQHANRATPTAQHLPAPAHNGVTP